MVMKLTNEESYKIQLVRGIAIIAVVFIHNTPSGMAQVWCRPFLNFSVATFLFVSGLLSSVERWNPFHRIKKVIFPYIIWSIIYTVLYNHNSILQLPTLCIKNLITGKAAAIMYYIFVYCQFTLLIPLIDYLAKSKYKYLGFIISPLEIIIVRLFPLILGYRINSYISMIVQVSCVGLFVYFYLGYLIGNNYIHIEFKTSNLILACWGRLSENSDNLI